MKTNMKNRLYSCLTLVPRPVLALILGLSIATGITGCGLTPGQQIVAAGVGVGEAIGTKILRAHSVNGVVDPTYLASYEAEIANVGGLMQGKITPADLHTLLANANGTSLSADQQSVVGLLNGVTSEFVKVNGGTPPTPDGNNVDAAAKQVAVGLGDAVGLVTGTNYTGPTS